MLKKVIAVDFDGTIVEDAYPEVGKLKPNAMLVLKKLANAGHKIVIWTLRDYGVIMDFIESQNIRSGFMLMNLYINENPTELRNKYGNDPRKVGADVFIDDRNIFCKEINWYDIEKEFERLGYFKK